MKALWMVKNGKVDKGSIGVSGISQFQNTQDSSKAASEVYEELRK